MKIEQEVIRELDCMKSVTILKVKRVCDTIADVKVRVTTPTMSIKAIIHLCGNNEQQAVIKRITSGGILLYESNENQRDWNNQLADEIWLDKASEVLAKKVIIKI